MKHTIRLFFFLFLLQSGYTFAQQTPTWLYTGTIDNKAITFYVTTKADPCGGNEHYMGIYRYGNSSKWILLTAETQYGKGNFCYTEHNFTGVMILQKSDSGMTGIWISPDGKRQLKVVLSVQKMVPDDSRKYETIYEDTVYEYDDC
jgi:hypothetical protein